MQESYAALAIQRHAAQANRSSRLTLAAFVALGATVNHTKTALGYAVGRPKLASPEKSCSDSNINSPTKKREPWPKLVARLSGKSYEWCNTLAKAAGAIQKHLAASESPADQAAAATLAEPPLEWTEDDYLGLAEVIEHRFDADTFTGLILELGLFRDPNQLPESPAHRLDGHRGTGAGGHGDDTKTGRAEEAQLIFREMMKKLWTSRTIKPDAYLDRLHALPLRAKDPTTEVGLLELRAEHEAHLKTIKAVIDSRESDRTGLSS